MYQNDFPRSADQAGAEALVSRVEVARILSSSGFRTSLSTLAKLAITGDGPEFIKFGRHVMYDPVVALKWARERSLIRRSTSDAGRRWASSTSVIADQSGLSLNKNGGKS
jgi:hypothetical protein